MALMPNPEWSWGFLISWCQGVEKRLRALEAMPSSEGEEMESSPLEVRLYNLEHQIRDLYSRIDNPQARAITLEAGLQSPPIMANPTRGSLSAAEPCPICPNHPAAGHCPVCHLGAQEPDSPPESTEAATPPSSPSGQPTTISLVAPKCGCAPPTWRFKPSGATEGWDLSCPGGALLATVKIVAQAVPASPSENTST